MSNETKTCKACQQNFTVEPDDFDFYKKMQVPAPVNCPDCRFRWRALWRNEMTLYNQKCKLCDKSVITMYNPKSPYIVYCNDCWTSDKWDPFSYAMEYDPARPFFDQFDELLKKVPKCATYSTASMGPNINSEYSNFAGSNKDCYLVFNSGPNNENCAYTRGIMRSRDVFDAYFGLDVQRSYEGVNIQKSSGVVWGQNVVECLDSWLLFACSGCTNCFGCVNLRNKSYQFFNEQLSKEEWHKRVGEIQGSYAKLEEVKKRFREFALKFPRRENNNLKSVGSSGDYVFECKNAVSCFEVSDCENVKYCFAPKFVRDSYDILGHGRQSELLLEGVGVGVATKVIGSWWVDNAHDIEYSFATRSGQYCFGCDAIKGGSYVILNKRYSEEEYKKIRAQIVAELKQKDLYGLFIPPALSPFSYNETVGQDNMPLTKEQAVAMGFRWEEGKQVTSGKETLRPEQIPDHISEVQDLILKEILMCVTCSRNYRITPAELQFYRKMVLPIPRQCFYCRHADRLKRRGPMKIFDRKCAKCQKGIKTTYAPERPEIVYCESCYQQEVI